MLIQKEACRLESRYQYRRVEKSTFENHYTSSSVSSLLPFSPHLNHLKDGEDFLTVKTPLPRSGSPDSDLLIKPSTWDKTNAECRFFNGELRGL